MEKPKQKRGFALLDKKVLKEVSARGGSATKDRRHLHAFTKKDAKLAGQKGGRVNAEKPGYMRKIALLSAAARKRRREEQSV
jgi:uncharacterized protein